MPILLSEKMYGERTMTVEELIEKLKQYPGYMKICIGKEIYEEINCTVLEVGEYIYDSVDLEEPYLSLW